MRHFLVLIFIVIFPTFSFAGYEEGEVAFDMEKYKTAFKEFLPIAESGSTGAQFYVAYMYDNGLGMVKDNKKAEKWYRKAAVRGMIEAQYNLAHLYDIGGFGIDKQPKEAMKWFTAAAKQGDVSSLYNLGIFYEAGRVVEQDLAKARKLYKVAAMKGHEKAAEAFKRVNLLQLSQ